MQIVFRHVSDEHFAQPLAGELILRLRHHTATADRAMAEYVLKNGLASFPQGAAPIEQIVAAHEPTLDDMLAVEFAQRLLAGETLPEGMKSFARYAALAREGLKPGDVPLDSSLEGIFLAMRNNAGDDLSKPEVAVKFVADWPRLASRIASAAAAGVDPFTQPFLAEGPDFARERSFLRRDHEVFRQDVERGQQWSVQIPDGPPHSYGLVLYKPKSLLFKFWSRDPESGRKGKPYLLLGVQRGERQWAFSTDPVQRLSLKGLHDKLQAAEAQGDKSRAASDPWFDGAPFGHTLVASPKHGTALNDDHVLRIVRQWAQAKPLGAAAAKIAPKFDILVKLTGLASAVAALVTFYLVWVRPMPAPVLAKRISETTTPIIAAGGDQLRGVVEKDDTLIDAGKQQTIDLLGYNPTNVEQHVKLKLHLQGKDPQDTPHLKLQSFYVNEDDRPHYADFELREGKWQPKEDGKQSAGDKEALATVFHKGQNKVRIVAASDQNKPVAAQARLEWEVDRSYLPDLHVLAVGVGDSLPHSVDDAQALYDFFGRKDNGLLFNKVHRIDPPLINASATKDAIFDAISELTKQAKRGDVVLISISAHGTVVGDRYYLLPSGWNETELNVAKLNATAISQDDFLSSLKELAEKCYVLVVLDTCHAGALAMGGTTRDVEAPVDMNHFIDTKKLSDRMQRNPKGIVIVSACLGNEQANELTALKHGVLTFALLEGLQGKLIYPDSRTDDSEQFLPKGRVVDLAQLNLYIEERVKRLTEQLTNHEQSVVVTDLQGISLGDIPLLVRPETGAGK